MRNSAALSAAPMLTASGDTSSTGAGQPVVKAASAIAPAAATYLRIHCMGLSFSQNPVHPAR
jgi:hypothetical protein